MDMLRVQIRLMQQGTSSLTQHMQPWAGACAATHVAHLQKVHTMEGTEWQGTQ